MIFMETVVIIDNKFLSNKDFNLKIILFRNLDTLTSFTFYIAAYISARRFELGHGHQLSIVFVFEYLRICL